MDKQEFQQMTIRQELDYLKQVIEKHYAGMEKNLSLTLNKYIIGKRTIALAISWKEPSGISDKINSNYFQELFEGLVKSVVFDAKPYMSEESDSGIRFHYYLYY